MQRHPTIKRLVMSKRGKFYLELSPTDEGDPGGYRSMTIPVHNGSIRERVHRLVWEITHGRAVPDGYVVRHLDDNRANNAPANLRLGKQAHNMKDMVRNGRSTRGAKNARAKLAGEEAVRDIRSRRQAGETLRSIGSEYGLTIQAVCDICKGRTWGWVK